MSPLTPTQRQVLAAALRQRAQTLRERLDDHHGGLSRAEHARELLEQDGHDARLREAERELDMAQSDRDTLDLAQVDQALQRLSSEEDYGRCADCDEDIPFARMQAEPWAMRCVACEERREKAAKRGL
jgi:DnaK suppressor protein